LSIRSEETTVVGGGAGGLAVHGAYTSSCN
jgi:hypothetical protein